MAVEELPDIGIGTYENTDPEVCAESVATALDCGYRHVDTAEGYGNERAVGEGIRRSDVDREDVFLATKVSPDNLSYDDVIDHAEASRERLGVKNVHGELSRLAQLGIIFFEEDGQSTRPVVWFDELVINSRSIQRLTTRSLPHPDPPP
jgi:hypothetical protein